MIYYWAAKWTVWIQEMVQCWNQFSHHHWAWFWCGWLQLIQKTLTAASFVFGVKTLKLTIYGWIRVRIWSFCTFPHRIKKFCRSRFLESAVNKHLLNQIVYCTITICSSGLVTRDRWDHIRFSSGTPKFPNYYKRALTSLLTLKGAKRPPKSLCDVGQR